MPKNFFQRINGEIYSIDEKMLNFLDEFESHPQLYVRRKEQVFFFCIESFVAERRENKIS